MSAIEPASDPRRTRVLVWSGTASALVLLGLLLTRAGYTVRIVTIGGSLLGALSGAIGCFSVLRRQSLLGDAVSHAALPGVAIAFLVAGRSLWALLVGATTASLLGVATIQFVSSTTRLKQDAAMAVVLAGWFGVGIGLLAFIQQRPDAGQAGLDSFIFGQAASIVRREVAFTGVVGAATLAMVALLWKELKLITFDPDFARANGIPVRLLGGALLTAMVLTIVLGLQIAGVVLMVGMLIAPGVAARQWTNSFRSMVLLAAGIGGVSGAAGSILSSLDADVPTGPMIIVVASLCVVVSIMFAPTRGLVWKMVNERRDRRTHAEANVLKTVRRYAEGHGDIDIATPTEFVVGVVGSVAHSALRRLIARGDLVTSGAGVTLTARGLGAVETTVSAIRDAGNGRD